jgi:hypothetical protein
MYEWVGYAHKSIMNIHSIIGVWEIAFDVNK